MRKNRFAPTHSRFRPEFDPKVKVFVTTKKIDTANGTIEAGSFLFVDEVGISVRRLKAMFEQRFMNYLPEGADEFKVLADRKDQLEKIKKQEVKVR